MAFQKIDIHPSSLTVAKDSVKRWSIAASDKKDILRFLEELELGKVNKGFKVSERRQMKYLGMLKVPLQSFAKPVAKLKVKDIERFEKALSSGSLKSIKGRSYSQSTMADMRQILKVYMRWKLGPTKALELTGWLDTRLPAKTPDYLSESHIGDLYRCCKSPRERFLIAVLFDSGARAEEFHNIRYEDIQMPQAQDNYVRITLKEEYSKTKGRTICLYWKHSLDAVRDFLKERTMNGIASADPVYDKSYDNTRKILNRLGKRVLKRSLHYHLFRHSSATYYASKMNRQQLCYRYGWKFSSDMPDIYISRSGMENKDLDEKFAGTEIETLRTQLAKREQDVELLKDRMARLEKEKAAVEAPGALLARALSDPDSRKIIAAELAKIDGHKILARNGREKPQHLDIQP